MCVTTDRHGRRIGRSALSCTTPNSPRRDGAASDVCAAAAAAKNSTAAAVSSSTRTLLVVDRRVGAVVVAEQVLREVLEHQMVGVRRVVAVAMRFARQQHEVEALVRLDQ